jgi:anaerobic dimethyl sulfoxide reductase subunit C (anchor subunit)
MQFALQEITLVFFTTLAPAGAVAFFCLVLESNLSDEARANRIEHWLVVPLTCVLAGLIASATHLGTPANALYVLTGLGRSPLSNEVTSAAAFLVLGGSFWMYSFPRPHRGRAKRAWGVVAAASALVFVALVAHAYAVESVLTWNEAYVPAAQWACAVFAGPLIALAALACARIDEPRARGRALVGAAAVSGVAACVLFGVQRATLASLATVAQQPSALELMPGYDAVIAIVGACVVGAVACGFAGIGCKGHRRAWTVGAAAVALVGCFAVRFVFYAVHLTAGV